ncbi:MAG TPA: pyridoxamine 5'-phosphate oxidase family protein [Methanosarcina sp.]|nr:pyridoxamine 5'-phosphate oxidase family protein [Methanosarcina sp.]
MSVNLMEYFNKNPRLGVLSTSSKDGKVDSAVFGSPHMIDEKTVLIATAQNRTFTNLLENPYAVYIIIEECMDASKDASTNMEPGASIMDWKGIRVYMKMKEYHTAGHLLEMIQSQIANIVGEEAAKMIHAAVTFEIYEVRPIVDFGQGWEKSI